MTQCGVSSPHPIPDPHHCKLRTQGFYGQLTTLTTNVMYAVKLGSSATLSVTGMPTTLPKTVSLNSGWTFVPCPFQSSIALSTGAPSFTYTQGDQYKSQAQFAEYCETAGVERGHPCPPTPQAGRLITRLHITPTNHHIHTTRFLALTLLLCPHVAPLSADDTYGWYGPLAQIQPGLGYQIKITGRNGGQATFPEV